MTSNRRYDARRDASEPQIVEALEAAGYDVERLPRPVDLRVRKAWYPRGINILLECKTADAKGRVKRRADQAEQNDFVDRGGAITVSSPDHALQELRFAEITITP